MSYSLPVFHRCRGFQSPSRPTVGVKADLSYGECCHRIPIGYRYLWSFYKKITVFFESTGLHGGDASFRYSSGKTPHVVRFSGEGPYRCLENAICAGNALYAGTKAFFVSIDSRRFPEVSIIIPINDTCQTMELPCPSVLPLFIAWTEAS